MGSTVCSLQQANDAMILERKKTDKGKSHKGNWRSDAPEASQGQTRDVPGAKTPGVDPGQLGSELPLVSFDSRIAGLPEFLDSHALLGGDLDGSNSH